LEGVVADLVAGGAERLPIGPVPVWGRECGGDCGEQFAELGADPVGERGVAVRRFTQKPDAIADVPLLVVVDVAVAVDETGSSVLAFR
jgi:hypothetical protein